MNNIFILPIWVALNFNCHSDSKLLFDNKELEKEVSTFLKELKKSDHEIMAVLVESYKERDSVFITLTNSYPDITKIKAYASYKGFYFCFGGDYPLNGYFRVVDPDPVPPKLLRKYEDYDGKTAINYEPFTMNLTFYKGRIVEPLNLNKE